MTQDGGFLSRWSRRKTEAARADEPDPERHHPPPGSSETGPPDPPDAMSAADIASLPRIEEFKADTDLLPFLRAGVPALLRKAALRRMWELDPAIRDFVGEARDYSYDWNVAGGVPVSGPLPPGEDIEATLRRMFSRPDASEPGAEGGSPAELQGETGQTSDPQGSQPIDDASDIETAVGDLSSIPPLGVPETDMSEPNLLEVATTPAPPSRPASYPTSRARRHGAAIPRLD